MTDIAENKAKFRAFANSLPPLFSVLPGDAQSLYEKLDSTQRDALAKLGNSPSELGELLLDIEDKNDGDIIDMSQARNRMAVHLINLHTKEMRMNPLLNPYPIIPAKNESFMGKILSNKLYLGIIIAVIILIIIILIVLVVVTSSEGFAVPKIEFRRR